MGMDPDLDRCAEMALRDMISLIGELAGLSREDAYTLCSLAADLRVTQTVNGSKGIHCMLAKKLLAGQLVPRTLPRIPPRVLPRKAF
jgi:acetamidase/formamidase